MGCFFFAGRSAEMSKRTVLDFKSLDYNPRLNTSSYVNVDFETEEEQVAVEGLKVNFADQTIYGNTFRLQNICLVKKSQNVLG